MTLPGAQLTPITQAARRRGGHLDKAGVLLERRKEGRMLSKPHCPLQRASHKERRRGATLQLTVKTKLKTSDGVLETKVGLGDCSLKAAHDGFVIA